MLHAANCIKSQKPDEQQCKKHQRQRKQHRGCAIFNSWLDLLGPPRRPRQVKESRLTQPATTANNDNAASPRHVVPKPQVTLNDPHAGADHHLAYHQQRSGTKPNSKPTE